MHYRAGIIGCGKIAGGNNDDLDHKWKTHALAFKRNKKVKLISCYDINKNKSEFFSKKWKCKNSKNLKDFLSEKLDIVSICSPTKYHYHHIKLCILNNVKFIWLEKPSVENIAQFKEIRKLQQKYKSKISINYIRRYDPIYLNILKRAKHLGKCKYIDIHYTKGFIHTCSHFINYLNYIFNDKLKITAIIKTKKNESPNVYAIIKDIKVNLIFYDLDYEINNLKFYFEKGSLEFFNFGKYLSIKIFDKKKNEFKQKILNKNLLNRHMDIALDNLIKSKNIVEFYEDKNLFKLKELFKKI